jgi:lipopolysaccharide biosynthesis protein
MLNGPQLNDTLKQIFWKLPLSAGFKERLRSKRYERILEREAASNSAPASVTDDAALLSDYAAYVLDSYGKRAEGYREYHELGPLESDVLLVAYYLTQFHPNPENDAWWGRGTTEWNNVDRAVPQFVGHYQPRRPGELGYYDLRIKDTFRRQIEIAKNYGVGAFCFYYYWFDGGKRLLDFPLNEFLTDPSLDMPFFYCWANENWTRRFSGTDNNVLMRITPTVENYLGFMRTAARDFSDARYLRIGGSPVVQVYRPSLIPEPKRVVAGWRDIAREECGSDVYLIAVQERDTAIDWAAVGFDAESEFQPKQIQHKCRNITNQVRPIRKDFGGTVYDYAELVESRHYVNPDSEGKKVYPAVMPMWDNTARRNHRGTIFHGSTPELYERWLAGTVSAVRNRDDLDRKMVFINAWNEWGEGTYLEPDSYWGYAYLQATRDVLDGSSVYGSEPDTRL